MPSKVRAALLALLASSIALTAQQQTAPGQPTFRAEANYVRVDMYATLNGVPVTDLRQDEIEILDNGVPQKIEQFERVQIRTGAAQEARVEPNTVRESRAMVEEGRARVFVLFLDTYHVEVAGSHNIRAPLVKLLDQIMGPDDLVGVMTPQMSAADLTFARKTTTIDGFLTRYWYWGDRDKLNSSDEEKNEYKQCYPGTGPTPVCADDDRGVAEEMIDRLREKRTLDALEDLVVHLRGLREERKAVIAITDGWVLFRPNPTLNRRLNCRIPTVDAVGIDPRTGRLAARAPEGYSTIDKCDRDRSTLSTIDDWTDFQRILQEANRANTSFYPVDPRGLAVFDTGLDRPIMPALVNAAILRARADALTTLAAETDGLAIVNTNKIDAGMSRIAADLTSYYLLGYYTTAPLDGKFHQITVRVKRSGVQVRARRGYLAPSKAELARTTSSPAPVSPAEAAAVAESRAIESVVAPLETFARDVPLRLRFVSGPGRLWVTGEFGAAEMRGAWKDGGAIDLLLMQPGGETVASGRASVAAGARTFEATLPITVPGNYEVAVRARPAGPDGRPLNDSLKVVVADTPSGVRYQRRGPTTLNRFVPAADLRFRRSEAIRAEWPGTREGAARLLDRTGKALAVPVSVSTREEDGGWTTAEVALTPLAPGDYVIELTSGADRRLAAFRVVP